MGAMVHDPYAPPITSAPAKGEEPSSGWPLYVAVLLQAVASPFFRRAAWRVIGGGQGLSTAAKILPYISFPSRLLAALVMTLVGDRRRFARVTAQVSLAAFALAAVSIATIRMSLPVHAALYAAAILATARFAELSACYVLKPVSVRGAYIATFAIILARRPADDHGARADRTFAVFGAGDGSARNARRVHRAPPLIACPCYLGACTAIA